MQVAEVIDQPRERVKTMFPDIVLPSSMLDTLAEADKDSLAKVHTFAQTRG